MPLSVEVASTETKTDSSGQARTKTWYEVRATYSDKSTKTNSWSVQRSFQEFAALDRALKHQSNSPDLAQISFPSQQLRNRFSEAEINERKSKLSHYLQELNSVSNILSQSAFCRFINFYSHVESAIPPTESEEPQQLARALHFFTGRTESELSVDKGDVVIYLRDEQKEWAECILRGELGFVPKNYLQTMDGNDAMADFDQEDGVIDEDEIAADQAQAPPLPKPYAPFLAPLDKKKRRTKLLDQLALRGTGLQVDESENLVHSAQAEQKSTKDVVAVALFDYEGVEETELSFHKGDQIIVYSQEPPWWQGSHNGHIGYFPGDYVALLDGQTPLEIIAAAGPQKNPGTLTKESKEIEDQLKKRILEQAELMEQTKKKLSWTAPGTPAYKAVFEVLEEHRTLHDSLVNNLKRQQQINKEQNAPKELSIVDQVKEKINHHREAMQKLQAEAKACKTPAEKRSIQNQIEEQEMLLKALYENLESLAMYKLREEEIQRQLKEGEVIVALRSKVAAQMRKVEQCRARLVNCSGSYDDTIRVKQELEENVTLLQALQANLDAMCANEGQPNALEAPLRHEKSRASVLFKKMKRKTMIRSEGTPNRSSRYIADNVTAHATLHSDRSASSFFSPVTPTAKKTQSARMTSLSQSQESFKPLPSVPPKMKEQTAPTSLSAPGTPLPPAEPSESKPRKKEAKISRSTQTVDQEIMGTKKKRNVRVACAADNERSVMAAKKKYYCILCACEDFEPSPPPRPENCRNCKHDFSTHRLHRSKCNSILPCL